MVFQLFNCAYQCQSLEKKSFAPTIASQTPKVLSMSVKSVVVGIYPLDMLVLQHKAQRAEPEECKMN